MGVKDLDDPKKLAMLRSQIDRITVDDIMDTDFPSVSPEDRLSDALSVMRDTNYQDIPVVENGNYLGVISYTAVLKKGSAKLDTKVRSLIRGLPTVSKNEKLTEIAEDIVKNCCRQLPVLSGKKLVGMVSRTGLVKAASEIKALGEIKVWELMTNPVESVNAKAMLSDALDIMKRLDSLTVPVINDANKVVGVVGMKEVIDANWKTDAKSIGDLQKKSKAQITVESVSVTVPITVNWDDTVKDAAALMIEKNISTLPVVDGEALVGIMTQFDIIEVLSACRERDMLFIQISGLEDEEKNVADALYEIIGEQIVKINKVYRPQSLNIHVAKYNDDGGLTKYSVTGRLYLENTSINVKEVDWDLVRTVSDLMKKMSETVMTMKDSKVSFRQRKR
ncbi:MAG: CBS domain-containing protein [Candidatus Methanomethylophilaceae archaeon]|jgi:CBS domain-containing protein